VQEQQQQQQQQQQSLSEHPDQSSSPSTMPPQNYVQQLASALGLNSNITSTDFESLIELNRRQQHQVQLNVSNVTMIKVVEGNECSLANN